MPWQPGGHGRGALDREGDRDAASVWLRLCTHSPLPSSREPRKPPTPEAGTFFPYITGSLMKSSQILPFFPFARYDLCSENMLSLHLTVHTYTHTHTHTHTYHPASVRTQLSGQRIFKETALAPLPTGCPQNRSCSGKSPNKPGTARQPAACSGRLLPPSFLGPKRQRLAPKARSPHVPITRSRRAARWPMAAFCPHRHVLLPEV